MIHGRGWGWLALAIPIVLWFGIIFVYLGWTGGAGMSSAEATRALYRSFALGFGAAAIILGEIARYRARIAPGRDHLAEIPLRYWPYIWGVMAVMALALSFIPAAVNTAQTPLHNLPF